MSILELFKVAAVSPLTGKLFLSQSGWLILSVPNAIGRGAFDALHVPGTELPASETTGHYNAHITVMRPEELAGIGGANKITERGHEFSYSLGKVKDFNPLGWPEMNRCWVMEIRSPALEKLRKSYGLPAIPHDGEYKFHMTFAVRKSGVLGENETSKAKVTGNGSTKQVRLPWDKPGTHVVKTSKVHPLRPVNEDSDFEDPSYDPKHPEECCPSCGARLERGDDGDCNRCGKPWPKEAADKVTLSQAVARAARKAVAPKSEAQAEAGNYRKGHVYMHGLNISIETKKGDKRSPEWPALNNHYGYIRRTTDADGDSVDVFLGGSPDTELVFVVDQIDPKTKKFDEHKCMLGFNTLAEAKEAYLANYEKDWNGLGRITPLTIYQFKEWLEDGSQHRPVSTQTFKMKKKAADSDDADDKPGVLALQRSLTIRMVPPEQKGKSEDKYALVRRMEDELEQLLKRFNIEENADAD